MSPLTILGILFVLLFWITSVFREKRIGISIRFMYALNLFQFFLLGPILGEIFPSNSSRFNTYPMEPAIQLCCIGLFFFVLAAYWISPFILGRSTIIPDNYETIAKDPTRLQKQIQYAWYFIVLGLLLSPIFGSAKSLPTIGAIFNQSAFLLDTGMTILCLYSASSKKYQYLALGFVFFIIKYLIFSSISGHAGSLFINGIVLACLALFSFRIRLIHIPILSVISLLIFFPATYWLSGREEVRENVKQDIAIEERISKTIDIFINPRNKAEKSLVESYRERGDYSDLMAAAIAYTPVIEPYGYGESYLNTFVAIVPRFFWPDKPYVLGGSEFVSKYTGITFGANTSVGMNYIFEMYVNFGFFGVVLGMLILGFLFAILEHIYYKYMTKSIKVELVIAHISWILCFNSDRFSEAIMSALPGVLFIIIVSNIISLFINNSTKSVK